MTFVSQSVAAYVLFHDTVRVGMASAAAHVGNRLQFPLSWHLFQAVLLACIPLAVKEQVSTLLCGNTIWATFGSVLQSLPSSAVS